MRSSNSASREYDSFNPTHQAIYRPLTVVGWKPYRMTVMQRCARVGRITLECVVIFVFRTLPGAIGRGVTSALSWSGARIQKPDLATIKAVAANSQPTGRSTSTS
ncbi:MAG: hypothetical protein ACI9R3_004887 [Verrucomicrobiales bacterium]|jgi:hypothetical protein